jgi:hypothetical protein
VKLAAGLQPSRGTQSYRVPGTHYHLLPIDTPHDEACEQAYAWTVRIADLRQTLLQCASTWKQVRLACGTRAAPPLPVRKPVARDGPMQAAVNSLLAGLPGCGTGRRIKLARLSARRASSEDARADGAHAAQHAEERPPARWLYADGSYGLV